MMGTPKGTAFTLNSSSPKLTFFTDGELRSEQERGWGGGGAGILGGHRQG